MRPLVCFIATSLDGYIAGPNGEIDWLFTDQDYGYTQFYATVDTVVMGTTSVSRSASIPTQGYRTMSGHAPITRRTSTLPSGRAISRGC